LIKILIADDHELIREGIKKIVRSCSDMTLAGEAASMDELLRLVRANPVDVIVLDLSLPDSDSLAGLQKLRQHYPQTPVLVLSMHPEERFAVPALRAGAAGYVTKGMAVAELVKAIRSVHAGATYISETVAALLAKNLQEKPDGPPHLGLTDRELQVLRMLAAGQRNKSIAAELMITVSSVNTYRARILTKMGMRSNAELIRYAVSHGLT
jgi:two-component system invasion response regulator UvrY